MNYREPSRHLTQSQRSPSIDYLKVFMGKHPELLTHHEEGGASTENHYLIQSLYFTNKEIKTKELN